MTAFGRRVALACVLLLVLLISGFSFILPRLSNRPSDLLTPTRATGSQSANSQSGLPSPSNDASQHVEPGGVRSSATLAPNLLSPPSQAALLYRPSGLENPQATTTPASGSASTAALVSSVPAGSSGGASPGTMTIPILMYHYVRVVTNPRDIIGKNLSVTPALFAQQMQYLADHGYTTLTLHDIYCILTGAELLPAKPIALTFDDGYLDFYTHAWPILKEHNFNSTSYIITGSCGWRCLHDLGPDSRA